MPTGAHGVQYNCRVVAPTLSCAGCDVAVWVAPKIASHPKAVTGVSRSPHCRAPQTSFSGTPFHVYNVFKHFYGNGDFSSLTLTQSVILASH